MSPLGGHLGQLGATPKTVSWGLGLDCPATDQRRSGGPSVTSQGWPAGHMSQGGAASWMKTSVTWSGGCMWSVVHSSLPVASPHHPSSEHRYVHTTIYSAVLLAPTPTQLSAAI